MLHDEKMSMSDYFDMGIENDSLLLDASNLEWDTFYIYSSIKRAIENTFKRNVKEFDWGYSSTGGKQKLRELIALHESYLEETEIFPDDIIVTQNGTTGAVNYVLQAIFKLNGFKKGIKAMLPKPSYDGFDRIFDLYEYQTITICLRAENDFKMTLDDVVSCYEEGVKVILIPNPSNPVCKFIDPDEMDKIIRFCIEKDMYIIYDAIFEEAVCYNNKRINVFQVAASYNKLIKVKGLSKDAPNLSDFRCGWSICKDTKFNELLLAINSATTFSNPTFLEDIEIVEMQNRVNVDIKDTSALTQEYLREKVAYHQATKKIFYSAYNYLMQNLDVVRKVYYPDAGNIMYITLRKEVCNLKGVFTSHELFMKIMNEENILVTPGHCFGAALDDLSFRVTISRNSTDFIAGLKRIVELFK